MKDNFNIGQRIKALRGALSQKDFSRKVGVPFRSFQRYESGERVPSVEILKRISDQTGTPLDRLIKGEESSADYKQFAEYLTAADAPRVVVGKDLNLYVCKLIKDKDKTNLSVRKMDPELFDQFLRILEEGDKTKLEAVKAQLKALDPKKKDS